MGWAIFRGLCNFEGSLTYPERKNVPNEWENVDSPVLAEVLPGKQVAVNFHQLYSQHQPQLPKKWYFPMFSRYRVVSLFAGDGTPKVGGINQLHLEFVEIPKKQRFTHLKFDIAPGKIHHPQKGKYMDRLPTIEAMLNFGGV